MCLYSTFRTGSPRMLRSSPLKQMEKLRHARPPTQSPWGAGSRSRHRSAASFCQDPVKIWFHNQTQSPEKGGLPPSTGAHVSEKVCMYIGNALNPTCIFSYNLRNRSMAESTDNSHLVGRQGVRAALLWSSPPQVYMVSLNILSPSVLFLPNRKPPGEKRCFKLLLIFYNLWIKALRVSLRFAERRDYEDAENKKM